MLKTIRVIISIAFFSLLTFLFMDFAGLLPNSFHVLAHLQFIPAWLAQSLGIMLFLLLLTALLGRVYCSSICPMGVFQDIAAWLSKKTAKKKKRYTYSPAKTILRWSVLAAALLAFFLNYPVVMGVIDPYSAYGRIAVNLFKPVYMAGNNVLESIFTGFGNYTFYKVDVAIWSSLTFAVALITFLAIGFLAWKHGRTYCNTVCPVGTVLGLISKYSVIKIGIDQSTCNGCGLCASQCKASCIDSKLHQVDNSRCVACFNCLDSCKQKALSYKFRYRKKTQENGTKQPADLSKRQFLLTSAAAVASVPAALAQSKLDKLTGGGKYARQTPISPPGAKSAENLMKHCTSCHLCVSRCPSNVLKPALLEYGVGGIMQPVMSFDRGYCNYDCTVCTEVCPNGALHALTVDEKHKTQVGHVVFRKEICVVHAYGTNCGACAEHCPTQAVTMVPYKNGLSIPHTDPDICIGCGGCEFICPVRPHTAIHVEGNPVHLTAKAFEEEEKSDVVIDGFGF
ncbi:MAG: 4Fe-4S dicluster domain-containing protein [Prevotella sp.]|jgi:ferredoxin|nr:4Fe-4S dicluster domain-containing protein [Prevotella sp.]